MLLGGGSNCQGCGCSQDCFVGQSPDTGSIEFYLDSPLAQAIEVGSTGVTLTSVTIYNDGISEPLISKLGGGYVNAPRCSIWSSSVASPSSCPDDKIPTGSGKLVTLTPPASFAGATWVFTHAGYVLSANTTYWVVMDCELSAQSAFWKYDEYLMDIDCICYFLSAFSNNAGASWTGGKGGLRFLMDVA
jgi:hypothetical protein